MSSFLPRKHKALCWKKENRWKHQSAESRGSKALNYSKAFQHWGRGHVSAERKSELQDIESNRRALMRDPSAYVPGLWHVGWVRVGDKTREEDTCWSCQSLDHQIYQVLGTRILANWWPVQSGLQICFVIYHKSNGELMTCFKQDSDMVFTWLWL